MENVEFRCGDFRIAGQLYLPSADDFPPPYPGVVVCHGIGSCKESHAGFGAFLADHGIAALAFDFRGHGASQGKLDGHTEDDVLAALDLLAAHRQIDPSRLGLRGSSMGALFAIRAAVKASRVRAITVIAPAVDALFAADLESGHLLHLLEREHLPVRIDVPAFAKELRAHDTRLEVAGLAPRALLLIQCKGDELVPFTWTEELFGLAHEPKQLLLLEGGHHLFAQQDIAVHQDTVEWFEKYL